MPYSPSRRHLLTTSLGASAFWFLPGIADANAASHINLGREEPFSFDDLKARAQALAAKPYAPAPVRAFDTLEAIDYDAYGRISFNSDMTLWPDPAQGPAIRFFHLQRYAKDPVSIFVVDGGKARQILYEPDFFDIPKGSPARGLPRDIGFAGFRVLEKGKDTDWLAFMGASYFRTSGPFGQFGLSARGIAVDTAAPSPEEFPRFTSFWLERDGSDGIVIYALLDGPSVSGAYRIASQRQPGGATQTVETALFMRKAVEKLGIAPLTSMFWYGENNHKDSHDWRPEIHDSDGLAIWTGTGERIWRPIENPPRVMTNAFIDTNPKGFGLLQRDRDFDHYQDDGVFYDKRSSLWVEPIGQWGKGSVQLVEIPTTDEIHDNIVAFWVPDAPAAAQSSFGLQYRLHWLAEEPFPADVARVVATRIGSGGNPGQPRPPDMRKFVIDFEGAKLKGLTHKSGVRAVVSTSRGTLEEVATYPVVGTKLWRMLIDLKVTGAAPVDLRAFLARGDDALSETWLYQLFPGAAA